MAIKHLGGGVLQDGTQLAVIPGSSSAKRRSPSTTTCCWGRWSDAGEGLIAPGIIC